MDGTLMIRLKGIEQKYDLDKEAKKDLDYIRYLIDKKRYHKLTQAQKYQVGFYLGLVDIGCKQINAIRVELIKLRVGLSNEMPHGNKK